MTRWNEEQERWTAGRYGEEERRGDWRSESGEGAWRGRDWRDDDRGGSWRGDERREDWGWRGERAASERRPMERWSSERDRDEGRSEQREGRRYGAGEYGGGGGGGGGYAREYGRGEYGRGEYGRGRFGERGASPETRYGMPEDPTFGEGGAYGGGGGRYGGSTGGGGMYAGPSGEWTRGLVGGAYPRGGAERWSGYEREQGGYGRGESSGDFGRHHRGYGEGEEEQGPFERMGEKMKEGFRKLTGRGPKGYRRSDERIREDVSERIARSWVNAEEVEVKVEKGEVTLTGFVESREDKRRIEDLADEVFGVDEVHNHLRLRRERATQAYGAGQAHQPAGAQGTTGTTGQQTGQQPGQRTQGTPQQPGRH